MSTRQKYFVEQISVLYAKQAATNNGGLPVKIKMILFARDNCTCTNGIAMKLRSIQFKKNIRIILHKVSDIGSAFFDDCMPLCLQLLFLRLDAAGIFGI